MIFIGFHQNRYYSSECFFARLITGLHRGIESETKNINFGFNTREEASSACRDVIRAKLLICETNPQLTRVFHQSMPSGYIQLIHSINRTLKFFKTFKIILIFMCFS